VIVLNKVSLHFSQQPIFDSISCNINHDNRIGLVGRNGSGKSTLLKVLAGLQNIDSGEVSIQKGVRIGYMPQEVVLTSKRSIYQEAFSAFDAIAPLVNEAKELEEKLDSGDA